METCLLRRNLEREREREREWERERGLTEITNVKKFINLFIKRYCCLLLFATLYNALIITRI